VEMSVAKQERVIAPLLDTGSPQPDEPPAQTCGHIDGNANT
jgi:hypothetical protein